MVLDVKNLSVGLGTKDNQKLILNQVNFSVKRGETVAIVGESGCGKSMTALTVMGLLPEPVVSLVSGEILLQGKNLTNLSQKEMNKVRGKDVAMIFQEPMTTLNPSFTIGNQLGEIFKIHSNLNSEEIRKKCIEMLTKVKIPDPEAKLKVYPHQLSGGMRQRVVIAMALACNPKVIIADEPTTALDVTIQAQILDLLVELQTQFNTTVILITHDLGVVAETCQRAIVMYAGQVVEEGSVEELFEHPQHPYTKGLMDSIPRLGDARGKLHVIKGSVPDMDAMPQGCRFNPRCEVATDICRKEAPELEITSDGRRVRCWHKL
ncbi:ABC transporter ATP-binding protein [Neobacillus jeddahensis]|uniref:ABC transporter ATP-binding protein n=1 Tax=Neobacillus jeddahensis TaxID=1461580 RepID=UPI00058F0781|nr:ABC transporter ATP-binding protein [Neobacillus jeddahensis]